MTPERKSVPETEQKLILLYSLDLLGPVTDQQLCAFLVNCEVMDYFCAQFLLLDLTGAGLISSQPHPLGQLFALTGNGINTLKEFIHRIPSSIRSVLRDRAEADRSSFAAENSLPASAVTLPDGRYCIRLQLIEGEEVLLDLTLIRRDRKELTNLQKRWKETCGVIYQTLIRALSDGWDPAITIVPDPADNVFPEPDRTMTAVRDWLVFLPWKDAFSVTLSLPQEGLARYAAKQWKALGKDLSVRIPDLLMKPPISGISSDV